MDVWSNTQYAVYAVVDECLLDDGIRDVWMKRKVNRLIIYDRQIV